MAFETVVEVHFHVCKNKITLLRGFQAVYNILCEKAIC